MKATSTSMSSRYDVKTSLENPSSVKVPFDLPCEKYP
jgi:hypothetical protein